LGLLCASERRLLWTRRKSKKAARIEKPLINQKTVRHRNEKLFGRFFLFFREKPRKKAADFQK
jgi:hypothetical protein